MATRTATAPAAPATQLADEPPTDGYPRARSRRKTANVRAGTTGSQFFIVTDRARQGSAVRRTSTRLGTVTEGIDVVAEDRRARQPGPGPERPETQTTAMPLYINKVTITES